MKSETKINLLNRDKQYPYVLLPTEIIDFFEKDIEFDRLFKESKLTYPPETNKAIAIINNQFFKEFIELSRTLEDINNLKENSIDEDLEKHCFYVGKHKLPNMPKLYTTNKVRKKLNFIVFIGIFFLFFFGIGLFFLTIGSFFTHVLSKLLSTSFLTSLAILTSISSVAVLIFELIKNKNSEPEYEFENIFDYTAVERDLKLNKYKKEVQETFEIANKERLVEIANLNKLINSRKQELELNILKNNLEFYGLTISPFTNLKRGLTELFFLEYLHAGFGKNVKIDVAPNMNKPFIPDFVIIYSELGLFIDIEIDEPYSMDKGEIIHNDRSLDSERNQFFITHNWVVIRFSERQIVENPTECVSFIKKVISAIKNRNHEISTNLKIESLWTYEETILMKMNDERRNYLKHFKK